MTYSPLLLVHICGGIVGVVAGGASFMVRKGSRLHRRAGDVFVLSMVAMAASGAYLALMKGQRMNVFAGVFTLYLVSTAWLTVRRKNGETGLGERILLLIALATGGGALLFAWRAGHRPPGSHAAGPTAFYVVVAMIVLLSASGDLRMIVRGRLSGAQRLIRHLWRMGFALFIATASFFLGMSGDPVLRRSGLRATLFSPEVRKTHLPQVPVLLVVVLTIYWLVRVRSSSRQERSRSRSPRNAPLVAAIAHDVAPQEVNR